MNVLLIVAAVLLVWFVIATVVSKKMDKKAKAESAVLEGLKNKAFEELKKGKAYALAVKIKDALEKDKYYNFGAFPPEWDANAYGWFNHDLGGPGYGNIKIYYSESLTGALDGVRRRIRNNILTSTEEYNLKGRRWYGIENDNIGVMVHSQEYPEDPMDDSRRRIAKAFTHSEEDFQEPPSLKIAAKVIEDSGYGPCKLITSGEG